MTTFDVSSLLGLQLGTKNLQLIVSVQRIFRARSRAGPSRDDPKQEHFGAGSLGRRYGMTEKALIGLASKDDTPSVADNAQGQDLDFETVASYKLRVE